jgi:hypothetical protein
MQAPRLCLPTCHPTLPLQVSLVHEELDQERLLAAHKKLSQQQQSLQGSEAGGEPTAEEFAALQREVEEMGAGQLDKKALKQWKARQLQLMGAKAPKMQRTAATIGQRHRVRWLQPWGHHVCGGSQRRSCCGVVVLCT